MLKVTMKIMVFHESIYRQLEIKMYLEWMDEIILRIHSDSPCPGVIASWKECFTVAENELFDRVAEEKMSDWKFRPIYE